ncbi:hypothetical protein PSEUDO9AZ_10348 [Pseudomonas sp. 9AZ]|uniref:hypothetical protein n=1 Tax=Pseudomonas sp. 9AZ TaxID=2653168 RepID=UPI0012F1D3A3|nr:hypothetical protein [Pseudomonas sp. 9AZ]VXC26444.1 hypothetical protein PSEUDO9AZ_10348 [Pseudomonas sp. 9AZ]
MILYSLLASHFTKVYRELYPLWEAEALSCLQNGCNPSAFRNPLTVDHGQARLAMVNCQAQATQPVTFIAGNGMCSSGCIVNYLKAMQEGIMYCL